MDFQTISPSILYLHLYGWSFTRCGGNTYAWVCSELVVVVEEEEDDEEEVCPSLLWMRCCWSYHLLCFTFGYLRQ